MRISDLVAEVKGSMGRLARAGLLSLWIGGKPVPAGRPRVGRWGTYYPASYKRWQKESWVYVQDVKGLPSDRPIALLIEVICPRPKKTDHVAPMGDVDNFVKGPLDLLTKTEAAWNDDRQIVFLTVVKRWAEADEEVGFKLWWCEITDDT